MQVQFLKAREHIVEKFLNLKNIQGDFSIQLK